MKTQCIELTEASYQICADALSAELAKRPVVRGEDGGAVALVEFQQEQFRVTLLLDLWIRWDDLGAEEPEAERYDKFVSLTVSQASAVGPDGIYPVFVDDYEIRNLLNFD